MFETFVIVWLSVVTLIYLWITTAKRIRRNALKEIQVLSMSDCYYKDGTKVEDMEDFHKKRAILEYRRVGYNKLENGKIVSTVWLGVNHRLDGMGPPLIFETMVFKNEDSSMDIDLKRYPTLDDAIGGHSDMCRKWGKK